MRVQQQQQQKATTATAASAAAATAKQSTTTGMHSNLKSFVQELLFKKQPKKEHGIR